MQAALKEIRLTKSLYKEMEKFTTMIKTLESKYRSLGENSIMNLVMELKVLDLNALEPKREEILNDLESFAYLTKITDDVIWDYYEQVIEHCEGEQWITSLSQSNKDLFTKLKFRKLQSKFITKDESDISKEIEEMQSHIN